MVVVEPVNIPKILQQEIETIAREYGFNEVHVDPDWPGFGSGRVLRQAKTKNPESITFEYAFLRPAAELYKVHPELLRKVTRVVCLHERKHHDLQFFSNTNTEEWEIQSKASEAYGDHNEFAILDTLLLVYSFTKYSDKRELRKVVSHYLSNFTWISLREREQIVEELSNKKFYREKNLKRILLDD